MPPLQPTEPVEHVEPVQPVKRVEYVRPVPPTYVPVSPVARARQIIYLVLGILETLLIIRLVMRLLAANPSAGFSRLIYGLTGPFVAPFQGVFPTPAADGSAFEVATLLAIVIYILLAWCIMRIIDVTNRHDPDAAA
jgi:hypothetical protein